MIRGHRPSLGPGTFRSDSASDFSTNGCSITVGGLSSNHLALIPMDMASIARSKTRGIPSALYLSAALRTALPNILLSECSDTISRGQRFPPSPSLLPLPVAYHPL